MSLEARLVCTVYRKDAVVTKRQYVGGITDRN